jgi:hypothetical protein
MCTVSNMASTTTVGVDDRAARPQLAPVRAVEAGRDAHGVEDLDAACDLQPDRAEQHRPKPRSRAAATVAQADGQSSAAATTSSATCPPSDGSASRSSGTHGTESRSGATKAGGVRSASGCVGAGPQTKHVG